MKSTITHRHILYFTPRNELTKEQAEVTYNLLRQIPSVKIDRSCEKHIKISWIEKSEIADRRSEK